MAFIEGTDRFQSQLMDFFTFDNLIAEDNYVRVIDAFVNSLNLKDLGFIVYSGDNRGQKPYKTDILLKIHIYCFFNGIQSSRKQERECSRNIELIWLSGNLKPDHSTLANFCKDNAYPLKSVFREFNSLCRSLDLFDFKIFAFDGTKIKANCSKKRAFTLDRLKDSLSYIEAKANEYISKIDFSDDISQKAEFQKKLDLINQRKIQYSELEQKMIDENLSEVCLTDPDAKIMKNHGNIEPCYNVQSIVDSKNKLIADYDVSNQANDVGLLKPMSDKLFQDYDLNKLIHDNPDHIITEIADAGYYKASDLLAINSDNVKALVPKPKSSNSSAADGSSNFSKDNFSFVPDKDVYICPAGHQLSFSRKSKETRNGVSNYYKIYSCSSCSTCPFLDKCTKSVNGRSIKRNVNEDRLIQFDNEYKKDSSFYKLRKALVEHPFRYY